MYAFVTGIHTTCLTFLMLPAPPIELKTHGAAYKCFCFWHWQWHHLYTVYVVVNNGRAMSTALVAMEHGQMTTLLTVTQLILENLLVFWEWTLFPNLFQQWRSSLCVKA